MRALFAFAIGTTFSIMSAQAASAQTADWRGPYVGVALGSQFGQDGDVVTSIDPARNPQLTYQTFPEETTVYGEALDDTAYPVVFAGWRMPLSRFVVGVEGQFQEGGPKTSQSAASGGSVESTACGAPALGCIAGHDDTVSARVDIERTAVLRLTFGMPISDRALLSVYAGPAIAWGRFDLNQTSILSTSRPPVRGVDCFMQCPPSILTSQTTQNLGRAENDSAIGAVIGVVADVQMTKRLGLRADVGYARYEALRGTVGGTNGADSEVRAQSAAFNASIGVTARF